MNLVLLEEFTSHLLPDEAESPEPDPSMVSLQSHGDSWFLGRAACARAGIDHRVTMPVSLTADSLCLPKSGNSSFSCASKLFSLPLVIAVAPVSQENVVSQQDFGEWLCVCRSPVVPTAPSQLWFVCRRRRRGRGALFAQRLRCCVLMNNPRVKNTPRVIAVSVAQLFFEG